jgi:hypothetical protein
MHDDFVEYETLAIHANHHEFKGWFDTYLRATFGPRVRLRDNVEIEEEQYFEYLCGNFRVFIKSVPISGNDLRLVFFDNPQTQGLIGHLQQVIQAIKQEWHAAPLPYSFINIVRDPTATRIFEERWQELQKTLQVGANLSTVVLLGSILEGLLYYKLKHNFDEAKQKTHEVYKNGNPIDINDLTRWGLGKLILIAHECEWISQGVKFYNDLLIEYRNLIHPANHAKKYGDYTINKAACKTFMAAVKEALDELMAP